MAALIDALRDTCELKVVYPAGCSDATVAQSMSFACTPQNVASVRRKILGNLRVRGPGAATA